MTNRKTATAPSQDRGATARAEPILAKAWANQELEVDEIAGLFSLVGPDLQALYRVADDLRRRAVGDLGTYVVNRNINFTNICYKRCGFCAFSRTARSKEAFLMSSEAVLRDAGQAERLGATEICIQVGLIRDLAPDFYLRVFERIKAEAPSLHIHAVSPEEAVHGARRLGVPVHDYLLELRKAGLDSMPGTSAEILDDEIRRRISPRRIATSEWLEVIQEAHGLGIPTSATMMYGHVETALHRARHLTLLRDLQRRTGGLTEFVPLRFVGRRIRAGGALLSVPSVAPDDVLKMHAVARLVLGQCVPNIQVSWVKEGPELAGRCLRTGANDLGGTLMNESISSSAGAGNGELLRPARLREIIRNAGLTPAERSTLYHIRATFEDPAMRCVHPLDLVDERELRR